MHDPLLFAVAFDGQGGAQELAADATVRTLRSEQLAWAHLDANHAHTATWLRQAVPYLDNLAIEALLADETRPRFDEIDQGALVILRGVNLNDDAAPEDMISVRLWVDQARIISLQKRNLKAVQDILQKLQDGKGALDSGAFITQLILRLLERMEPTLATLDDRMDALEEQILHAPDKTLRSQIVELRREAIILRRYIAPQRDAVNRMRASELPWLEGKSRRRLQECYDRLSRYVEDLDAIRERSQIVQDELTTTLADRLNKNMYVLSVIAAIFLPLGFLTGLLGVNIGGLPGTEDPNAFLLFSLGMIVLVALQILLFRWLKWF
jgi:zinc transporter